MSFNAIRGQSEVEKSANYEGNQSLLMFERLRNPVIRKQMIGLRHQGNLADIEFLHYFMAITARELEGREYDRKESEGKKLFVPKTENELNQEIESKLLIVEASTPIERRDKPRSSLFGGASRVDPFFGREIITMDMILSSGTTPTQKQQSVIEAHEKGHVVRDYSSFTHTFYDEYFARGFDMSAVTITPEQYERLKVKQEVDGSQTILTPKQAREKLIRYLSKGSEIIERMSQLKNYYGMKSDEQFTKEHLDYARKHYVLDVMDNGMTNFFQAITAETEADFIELINTSGV